MTRWHVCIVSLSILITYLLHQYIVSNWTIMGKRGKRAGITNRLYNTLVHGESTSIIIPSTPDGHCFIHSVVNSWPHQLTTRPPPTMDEVKYAIHTEIEENSTYYSLLNGCNSDILLNQRHQYLVLKRYNIDIVDLVPIILCSVMP